MVEELTAELEDSERATYERLVRVLAHEVNNTVAATGSVLDSLLFYRGQLAEPDGGTQPGPGVTAAPLATWAELWDKLRTSVAQADELNLDRKRTVLSIITAFARATRM